MAAPTKDAIVAHLKSFGEIADSLHLAASSGWDHDKLVGIIKSLLADERVTCEATKKEGWKLTSEGQQYAEAGSPEVQVYNFLKKGPATKEALESGLGEVAKIGMGVAMRNKWIASDKATKAFSPTVDAVQDEVHADLQKYDSLGKDKLDALKKRKLITPTSITSFRVQKTDIFDSAKRAVAEVTAEMISKGTWKDTIFKPLNLESASGLRNRGGGLHPLMKVRTEIRNILLLMGFEEMKTNQWVESSFWNFDTLFQPQQHPARDAHDTFFIDQPARAQNLPQQYLEDVKEMHEKGGRGSIGWRYDWSEDEARKNLLRTHTTAVSSRTLHKMAEEYKKTGVFTPQKYFSIDRVFRNETLDHTHLAEFHQVEGFIADYNLGLGHLIGVLKEFFLRIGITKLRFKPAYNPYTEPSMEIFGWHPLLNKMVELGNSGIFRPEMLLPMGIPEDVTVVAWGIGLERTAARMYNTKGIRELFSHEQDMAETRKRPVSWLKRGDDY